jgi:integrase/recombinase XerD
MALTLYRRHTASCIKGYLQNFRVHFPTTKRERNKDCQCPINCEGKLSSELRVSNRSLHTSDWLQAQETALKWQEWRAVAEPLPKDPTVQYAVDSFLTSQGSQGRNVEKNTFHGFDVLLHQRLLPFAKSFASIRVFDDLDVVSKFVESWTNLQAGGPLADSTKKTEIERLRFFFNYCKDREWLKNNYAKKIKISFTTQKKFGLSPKEEQRLFDAIDSEELKVFCLVMRHSGLRISDATMLNASQLVTRVTNGEGFALKLFQKKTKELVYIPIPMLLADALHALPYKSGEYWFWTGKGTPDTAIDNMYNRFKVVVNKLKFDRSVSPHVLRHTFSINHLNAGTPVKFVSRWLGHHSTTITEKSYSHAVQETLLASDEAYDKSMLRQQEQQLKWSHASGAVSI